MEVYYSMRTKNSFLNFLANTGSHLLNVLLSFLCRTVFIHTLSQEYLGVNGLFGNILTVLNLAELGVGSAIIFYIYKPIAEEDVEGVGYAIPITDAEDIINELMNKTPVEEGEEGYLGVMGVSVPDQLVQGYGYPAGASVNQITEGSPAAEAGLRVYDIITGVNGRQITSFEQLQNVIHGYPAGETVELTVMRASSGNEFEELTISVTLAHQEDIQGAAEQTEPQPTQEAFIFR